MGDGSPHGVKDSQTKKQYYMQKDLDDVIYQIFNRNMDYVDYDYEFFAS